MLDEKLSDAAKVSNTAETSETVKTPDAVEIPDTEEVLQQARILWQKYLTLTKELLDFSDQRDNALFMELVDQREKLVESMKALPPNDYRETAECKALIEQIVPMDKQIIYRARAWLNKSRRQNSAVRSYDLFDSAEVRGVIFSKKY